MFNEKNNVNPFTYRAPEGTPYIKLEEFAEHSEEGKAYKVRGWYYTKGKYGEQLSLVMDDCIINMPKHLIDTFRSIQTNPVEVQAVNEGKLGIIPYAYNDRNGVKRFSVNLADI